MEFTQIVAGRAAMIGKIVAAAGIVSALGIGSAVGVFAGGPCIPTSSPVCKETVHSVDATYVGAGGSSLYVSVFSNSSGSPGSSPSPFGGVMVIYSNASTSLLGSATLASPSQFQTSGLGSASLSSIAVTLVDQNNQPAGTVLVSGTWSAIGGVQAYSVGTSSPYLDHPALASVSAVEMASPSIDLASGLTLQSAEMTYAQTVS